MKFYCNSCNTKYGIADEKVRGKVLKVRCKKCGNVITVREQSVPVDQASAKTTMPPRPPSKPAIDPKRVPWHYSINGQSFGPFAFEVLAKRFVSGELGDECYVWTDSFSSWKPVREVDIFKEALDRGQQVKPRQNTIGVSQALEAIKPEEFKRRQQQAKQADKPQAKEADKPQPEPRSEPKPAPVEPKHAEPEQAEPEPTESEPTEPEQAEPEPAEPEQAQPEQAGPTTSDDSQKDRLAKLRARLKPTSDATEQASPLDDDLVADGGGELSSGANKEHASSDSSSAHRPTLPIDDPSDEDLSGEESDEHSGLFAEDEAPGPSSPPDESASPDLDRIPFFGDAPKLGSESKEVADKESEGITGSLLIQLDSIQKQGRGKKTMLIVAALLIIGGLVATAIYLAGNAQPEQTVVQKGRSAAEDDDELVQRTYSANERNKILVLGSQHVGEDEGKDQAAAAENQEDEKPTSVASKQVGPSQQEGASERRVRGPKIKDDSSAMDEAFESATKRGAQEEGLRKSIDDGAVSNTKFDSPLAGKSDAFKGLSALDSTRSDPIYNPTDAIKAREKSTAGASKLTRKQISQGMRTVRRSIGICRQRHSRRGAPLDARKIYLTIAVEANGRVSSLELDPKRVRHTEFDRCMNSHQGRWKFPSFDGEAMKMRAPFVLE